MRLDIETLKKIESAFGEFTVDPVVRMVESNGYGPVPDLGLMFRFGYWNRINPDKLLALLPNGTEVIEENIDETDEGMYLWAYECYY